MSAATVAKKKQRIAWIDIAKGVTILTVIWGHSLPFGSLARNLIFCFHMPLFFILSGFTLKPAEDFKDLIAHTKKDFLRLIVPVILITILYSVFAILLRGASPATEAHNILYKLFWANGVAYAEGLPAMEMPWFLVALFISRLVLRILSLLFKSDFELVAILCGIAGMVLGGVKHVYLPFNFDTALACMIFVAGGMLANKYLSTLMKYRVPLFITASIFVYAMLAQGQYIEFAGHSYTPYTIMEGFAASFIVCVACNAASSIKLANKAFCFIGINTMPIFLTHHLDWIFYPLFANSNKYLECIPRTFFILLFGFVLNYIFKLIMKALGRICKPLKAQ